MKWISVNSNDHNQLFKCSACGNIVNYIEGKEEGLKQGRKEGMRFIL